MGSYWFTRGYLGFFNWSGVLYWVFLLALINHMCPSNQWSGWKRVEMPRRGLSFFVLLFCFQKKILEKLFLFFFVFVFLKKLFLLFFFYFQKNFFYFLGFVFQKKNLLHKSCKKLLKNSTQWVPFSPKMGKKWGRVIAVMLGSGHNTISRQLHPRPPPTLFF